MKKALPMLLISVIATIALAIEPTDRVTFTTAQPAPTGFTKWTFFWSMPEIDPGATLEYVVLDPDGKEYFRLTIPKGQRAGSEVRSNFSQGFAGGDPKVFFNKPISFTFMVDKGKIKFPEKARFEFEFGNTVAAIKQ